MDTLARRLGGDTARLERTEAFRAACRSYKYVGPNFSFLERLCLERMWAWLPGNVYPRWLAPNVISLAGGCCILAASALMWAYSPDMRGEAPPWVYAVQALLIFCYQTLDGSDGKQARATGSGSALGEMVDHGIDALTTAACACLCSDAAALGIYAGWTWLQIGALQAAFFISNMTLLHTGKQLINEVDIIELHWAAITFLLLTATLPGGTAKWHIPLAPFLRLEALPQPLAAVLRTVPYVGADGGLSMRGVMFVGSITGTVLNNLLYAFTVLGVYLLGHPTYAPLRNPKTDELLPGRGVPAALAQIGTVLAHAALVWLCAAATREYLGGGFGRVGAAIRARLGGDRAGAGSSGWEVVAGGGASGAGDSAGAMLQAHEVAGGLVGASDTLWLSLFALFLTCHMTFGDVLNRLMVTRVGQVAYPRFHWALLLLAGFAAMPRLVQEFGLAPADATRGHLVLCGVAAALYFQRTWATSWRVADALGVHFFTIKQSKAA